MDGIAFQGVAVFGAEGSGKSSLLAHLVSTGGRPFNITLLAHHFCRYDDPETLSPARFVQVLQNNTQTHTHTHTKSRV